MVLDVARKQPISLVEGGSVFYIKYLFKDCEDTFEEDNWNESKGQAKQLASACNNWEEK